MDSFHDTKDPTFRTSSEWDATESLLRDSIRRLTLLSNVSATMVLREDKTELVNGVIELLRPELDLDLAFNYLVEDDGERLRLNTAYGVPAERRAAFDFLEFGEAVSGNVAQRRAEIVRENVQQASDPMVEVVRSLGMTAYVCIPLIAAERLVGTFSVGTRRKTRFEKDDLELLRNIGVQMAMALERRRLIRVYRALQERGDRLGALTSALSEAATPTQVARAVIAHTTEIFKAHGTVVVRIADDGASLEILDAKAMPEDLKRQWTRFPADAPVPLADVVRLRETIIIESREEWARRYPSLAGMLETTGQHSMIIVPLVIESRAIGSMGIAFDTPRTFSSDDTNLATLIAQHCAQALERARLFEVAELARAAAEAADREKIDLLAAVSHDLRTPLNAIGGYVQLLDMGVRGPVTQEQRDDLRRIETNQQRLMYLVEELLRFASLSSSRRPREIKRIPAKEALTAAHDSVAPQARAKGIVLELEECVEDLCVSGDPERLQQILVNLVTNAIKFTPEGGKVTLSADLVSESSDVVLLRVKDTGPGIPPEMHSKIFEPFSQLPGRPHGSDGVGLGLAISRTLARAGGGDVSVQSAPGKGATFSVSLPRA